MTTVTPAAFALSSTAATPSRVLSAGRLAEGSIHSASRGTVAPRPAAGTASVSARPNVTIATRTAPSSAPAEGFPAHVPQLQVLLPSPTFPTHRHWEESPVPNLMQIDPRRPFPRQFVPDGATMGDWAQIEPLFKRLQER